MEDIADPVTSITKWVDDIMPRLRDDDPFGCDDFVSHRLPLDAAPET